MNYNILLVWVICSGFFLGFIVANVLDQYTKPYEINKHFDSMLDNCNSTFIVQGNNEADAQRWFVFSEKRTNNTVEYLYIPVLDCIRGVSNE